MAATRPDTPIVARHFPQISANPRNFHAGVARKRIATRDTRDTRVPTAVTAAGAASLTMPSPALASPQNADAAAMPTSPRQSSGGNARPPMMKRHSSQSSHGGSRQNVTSPGSQGEHHPLRHTVAGRQRHAKIVLPRNHSSGRNLAKMGRQAANAANVAHAVQQADDGRKHGRQRSHEGDTEIRLPGSLDESEGSRPQIRRNMTAYELPRNKSGTKLKKNYSHGQLSRLSSGRNLASMTGLTQKAPPSPGLKGKKSRPKSAEMAPQEKDLHAQEVELYSKQQGEKERRNSGGPKKVGFAVGSPGDTSDAEEAAPQMEGSGLQEDEWTEESASASPLSTRNNSRRTSVMIDKPPDRPPSTISHVASMPEAQSPSEAVNQVQQIRPEADRTPAQSEEEVDEDEEPSLKSMPKAPLLSHELPPGKASQQAPMPPLQRPQPPISPQAPQPPQQPQPPKPQSKSALHAAKDHPNPTAKRLTSTQMPAPALVSSVSALDDVHSIHGSPAPSLHGSIRGARSINGNDGAADQEPDELVSRFLPSASHPSIGSGANTGAMNTPKIGSFQGHTPEEDSTLNRSKTANFQTGPVSPGSTLSGSSGAATPAHGRSRIELRMMHDKALADREAAAERQPLVPHHIYDRRNETLKSYLNLAALGGDARGGFPTSTYMNLGPEIFQGRFKAVNTELKVVQKFRDPVAESVGRLRKLHGNKTSQRTSPQKQQAASGLKTSKSAITLPSRPHPNREASKLSTSASPPNGTPPTGAQAKSHSPQKTRPEMATPRSSLQIHNSGEQRKPPKRGVSFAGAEPETREIEKSEEANSPNTIARMLWDSVAG